MDIDISDFTQKNIIPYKEANRQIASFYLIDSQEHIIIFKEAYQNIETISSTLYGKYYSLLLFSIECSLKSLIFSLAKKNEKPERIYKIVRKHGHNLAKLSMEVKNRAKNRLKIWNVKDESFLQSLTGLSVESRYSFDIRMHKSKESFEEWICATGKISRRTSDRFMSREIFPFSLRIHKFAEKAYLGNKKLSGITGTDAGRIEKRLKKFYDAI